jgi:hypothetical protein
MSFTRRPIFVFLASLILSGVVVLKLGQLDLRQRAKLHRTDRYSLYLCTQILNESDIYLTEWIEYQLNVLGVRNICLINAGDIVRRAWLLSRYSISVVNKASAEQEFDYCLSCFDPPMKADDLLLVHDVDEFLNVRQADVIRKNYDKYDKFHFHEIRFGRKTRVGRTRPEMTCPCLVGYSHRTDEEMKNRSLPQLRDLFRCQVYHGWYSCDEGYGKVSLPTDPCDSVR